MSQIEIGIPDQILQLESYLSGIGAFFYKRAGTVFSLRPSEEDHIKGEISNGVLPGSVKPSQIPGGRPTYDAKSRRSADDLEKHLNNHHFYKE